MPRTPVTQKKFLEDAMVELGLTPEQFCARLSCMPDTLQKWIATGSKATEMPASVWELVRELLSAQRKLLSPRQQH